MKQNGVTGYLGQLPRIFTSPGSFLAGAMGRKQWGPALWINLTVLFLTFLVQAPELIRQVQEEARFDTLKPGFLASVSLGLASLIMLTVVFLVVAFMLYLFYGVGGCEGNYVHFFTLTVNAALVGTALPEILNALSTLVNGPGMESLGLAVFFPNLSSDSLAAVFLAQVNLFVLWFLWVVALGVAAYSGMRLRRSLIIALLYFLLRSLVLGFITYFIRSFGLNGGSVGF